MYKRYLNKKRKEIIILLGLILVLITLNATHRIEGELRWYDRGVLFITAPVQYVMSSIIKGTVRFANRYVLLLEVRSDNEELISRNRELMNEIYRLEEVLKENERLRRLLDFKKKFEGRVLSAEVIGRDTVQAFKAVRINKGRNDGVEVGTPVLSDQGLVGQVMRVLSSYSDVLLIVDPNSSIDAIVQDTRFRGVLEGRGVWDCRLKFLERLDEVNVGDVILTSGMERRFPKGIVMGIVSSVEKEDFGISQNVLVQPTVDFSRLEEVLLVMEK